MRTSNPVLNQRTFAGQRVGATGTEVMTIDGTVNKTLISIGLTAAMAYITWFDPTLAKFSWAGAIVGLILALVISFKPTTAPTLTPVYAICQGCFLGAFSRLVELSYPGVVFQAISLTFGTLICLLVAYKSGWIKVSDSFRRGVIAATGAVFLIYLVSFIMSLFGFQMSFMHGSGTISIVISLAVVTLAALNLVLDFDFIESASARGDSPKYMEWFGAFGLLVTLIWLYVELVRLLTKLQSSRN